MIKSQFFLDIFHLLLDGDDVNTIIHHLDYLSISEYNYTNGNSYLQRSLIHIISTNIDQKGRL